MVKIEKGMIFNRWTVLDVDVKKPHTKRKTKVKWAKCQCACGTIRYKEYRDLYSGRSKSCGCLTREKTKERNALNGIINKGTVFGKLTVIEDLGFRKQKSRDKMEKWSKCKCECGNIIEVRNNNLITHSTQSCGCVQSRGELLLSQIFRENNVDFLQQYSFPDLKGPKNGLLKFDFAIFKNNELFCLIEFQGRQHYKEADSVWKLSDSLEERQYRDKLKQEYCNTHNIDLYCIPYFHFSKINWDYLNNLINYN